MAGTSSSPGTSPAPGARGHLKIGVLKNPVKPGTEPDPDDPRNVVLKINGYQDLANCKLPRAYFKKITNDDYDIGAVEYDLPRNRFQCHLVHSLSNLSPVLHLLGTLLRKHGLWPSNWETLPNVEELIKATGITWNEKLEFEFDKKDGYEWTPASRYDARLKDEDDLDTDGLEVNDMYPDGRWAWCHEESLLMATLEAFREALKLPVDEANPLVKRLKSALSRDKDNNADSTQQVDSDTEKAGLDINEFVKTMLVDQDGLSHTLDNEDGQR
ncbi:hypothetical protein PG996_015486 [Apiospora saccharicola]|uniref:Uncharacterized protein n=1 Tax=Apiospora saccharicola TaxID=335842 RepID=A0ABR1TLZ7_9PEZI